MRQFIAYATEEGGCYQRPRLRVKARLAPIRLHGMWVDDEFTLAATKRRPDWFRCPILRRSRRGRRGTADARKAVTHHGALWFREQYRRWYARF